MMGLMEYPKIETVYRRDEHGSRKLIEGEWRNPVVQYLAPLPWVWTEKVDGTNIRVHWDGHKVEFAGRTDRAIIPQHLLEYLERTFGGDENEELFEQLFGDKDMILFGEGYGPKIQTNGHLYRDDPALILFDVFASSSGNGLWLNRESVEAIAASFGVPSVPVVSSSMSLLDAIAYVKEKPLSLINSAHEMEGLVCRPLVPVRERTGERVIVKVKVKDFT